MATTTHAATVRTMSRWRRVRMAIGQNLFQRWQQIPVCPNLPLAEAAQHAAHRVEERRRARARHAGTGIEAGSNEGARAVDRQRRRVSRERSPDAALEQIIFDVRSVKRADGFAVLLQVGADGANRLRAGKIAD